MAVIWTLERAPADLGVNPDQSDAAAFYDWGNLDNWLGTPDAPKGQVGMGFAGFGTDTHHDIAEAAGGTVAVYHRDYPSNVADGSLIPWDDATFIPSGDGDGGILISDGIVGALEHEGYELWRVYGKNFEYQPCPWGLEAFDAAQPCYAAGWRRGVSLLVGQVHHREANKVNAGSYQGHGGAMAPLMAGMLLVDEVQAAVAANTFVPHAITVAGLNPANGAYAVAHDQFNRPGNRVEHADHAGVNSAVDESPSTKLYFESARLHFDFGEDPEAYVDAWIEGLGLTGTALGKTKRAVALTFVHRGFVLWETAGAYPEIYSDGVAGTAWESELGVTSAPIAGNLLQGLVTSPDQIVALNPDDLLFDDDVSSSSFVPQAILV